MGEVAVGDQLIGADGRPTRVVAATEVHDRPALLRGRVLRRHGDRRRRRARLAHRHRAARPGAACGHAPRRRSPSACASRPTAMRLNHAVANAAPLQLPVPKLALPPYVLGAWLGAATRGGRRFRPRAAMRDRDVRRGGVGRPRSAPADLADARPGMLASSTSRRPTCGRRSGSAAPCSPACSTPTARSRRAGASVAVRR